MLDVRYTDAFRKGLEAVKRRRCDIGLPTHATDGLMNEGPSDPVYGGRPPKDTDGYRDMRGCRIRPDRPLAYRIEKGRAHTRPPRNGDP